MLNKIVEALQGRSDLAGWTARHITTRGAQVYLVPRQVEAQRAVDNEKYVIDVFRQTTAPDGTPAMGSGDATLLPGGDIEKAIDTASLVAGLVSNPVHNIPSPAPLPDVDLLDADLKNDPLAILNEISERMRAVTSRHPEARLTAGECFGEIHTTHLVNSRGIDAEQESTSIEVEFTLHGRKDGREVEMFGELGRRRVADLDIEAQVEKNARYMLDLLEVESHPSWQGIVILRDEALASFIAGDTLGDGVLQTLGSAALKYAKASAWEIGQSIFRREVTGDPLTVWANRCIPFGSASNRFDEEGIPAQRVELIRENKLLTFTASQRYADYLQIAPTGAFGGVELPAGKWKASELLAEPHVEIVQFSWFNPDPITGDFASEIRLGYLVENGIRKPFKGGQLIGNYLDALANVNWSAETGFFGNYQGPHTARFNDLKIAGNSN